MPPIHPGEEARVVGLQIRAAKHRAADRMFVKDQHLTVPQRGPHSLAAREMRIDLGTARLCKGPRTRSVCQIEPFDPFHPHIGHVGTWTAPRRERQASIVPSPTSTASPPTVALVSTPPRIESERWIRLGRCIS